MINIINDDDDDIEVKNVSIGVSKFEGVWERLVDYVFGEADKERYFPHATWHIIKNGHIETSSALEPDTIMKYDGKIYVLDAKYYQYGVSYDAGALPQTSSIQKQITYGKHIVENAKVLDEIPAKDVLNAFIMPFNADSDDKYKFVSVGTADWETYAPNTPNYAYVLGLLLDTKWLISEYVRHNDKEIELLANEIEESLELFKKKIYSSQ